MIFPLEKWVKPMVKPIHLPRSKRPPWSPPGQSATSRGRCDHRHDHQTPGLESWSQQKRPESRGENDGFYQQKVGTWSNIVVVMWETSVMTRFSDHYHQLSSIITIQCRIGETRRCPFWLVLSTKRLLTHSVVGCSPLGDFPTTWWLTPWTTYPQHVGLVQS